MLAKSEADILDLWRMGAWERLEREFVGYEKQAATLGERLESLFKPSRMLEEDSLPASREVEVESRRLHELDTVYDVWASEQKVFEEYRNCAKSVLTAFSELRRFWPDKSEEGYKKVLDAWRACYSSAAEFEVVLNNLPKGIVLPCL